MLQSAYNCCSLKNKTMVLVRTIDLDERVFQKLSGERHSARLNFPTDFYAIILNFALSLSGGLLAQFNSLDVYEIIRSMVVSKCRSNSSSLVSNKSLIRFTKSCRLAPVTQLF